MNSSIGSVLSVQDITSEMVGSGKECRFASVDDCIIALKASDSITWVLLGAIFTTLPAIFLFNLITAVEPESSTEQFVMSAFLILIMTIGVIFFITYYRVRQQVLIFDRMNQTVSIAGIRWKKPVTVHFSLVRPVTQYKNTASSMGYLAIRFPRRNGSIPVGLGSNRYEESWSWWLWYMDRDRPLPPSEVLDQYRERDNDRLCNEEYPEPRSECDYPEMVIWGGRYPT